MKAEEKKKAINCRFQLTETDEFFQWLNNQSNMTIAIRNLIYHAIDLYGTGDFLAPEIQKEVMRNTFIFEAAQNGIGGPVNPFADTGSSPQQVEIKNERDKKLVQEEGAETKSEIQLEEKAKGNDIYGNIDLNNL
ncbi:endonuclease Q family protein [Peribacillus aracenensis]|jgi:hypothetical protein|uniref:endonuclease Q family protein n=1 Tax=Peribacillus aracenensis TaxID=2976708 RepID=UPI0021A73014|nr:endonuclease Q family protein [Peribacillus sp. BBB004]